MRIIQRNKRLIWRDRILRWRTRERRWKNRGPKCRNSRTRRSRKKQSQCALKEVKTVREAKQRKDTDSFRESGIDPT